MICMTKSHNKNTPCPVLGPLFHICRVLPQWIKIRHPQTNIMQNLGTPNISKGQILIMIIHEYFNTKQSNINSLVYKNKSLFLQISKIYRQTQRKYSQFMHYGAMCLKLAKGSEFSNPNVRPLFWVQVVSQKD